MNALTITELGDDADLLVKPDAYLENHLTDLAVQISLLSTQYEAVRRAQRAKRALQQQNRVAVRTLTRDNDGRITDAVIKVMPLSEAIRLLQKRVDNADVANTEVQFYVWNQDGYDLTTSSNLRHMS